MKTKSKGPSQASLSFRDACSSETTAARDIPNGGRHAQQDGDRIISRKKKGKIILQESWPARHEETL